MTVGSTSAIVLSKTLTVIYPRCGTSPIEPYTMNLKPKDELEYKEYKTKALIELSELERLICSTKLKEKRMRELYNITCHQMRTLLKYHNKTVQDRDKELITVREMERDLIWKPRNKAFIEVTKDQRVQTSRDR